MNYFIWRNQDAGRNSVSMVAQSLFSHKQLHGKSTTEMQEMMFQEHHINWAHYDQSKKNGRLIVKETYTDKYAVPMSTEIGTCERTRWVVKPAWKFTEDKEKLMTMIPTYV
jgi:tRNA(His) 5'-end guanylyltransferase